jgi:hypothetical protein
MKFRRLLRDKEVSVRRDSVAATVRQKPAVWSARWRNRSQQRVLTQRAVAIATLGGRLRVESFPISPFANSLFFQGIIGLRGQSPLPATHTSGTFPQKPTLNARPFRFF